MSTHQKTDNSKGSATPEARANHKWGNDGFCEHGCRGHRTDFRSNDLCPVLVRHNVIKTEQQRETARSINRQASNLQRAQIKSGFLKHAWIRNSVPPGAPAPGHIDCPCGNAPESNYDPSNGNVHCACGVVYSWDGWILSAADNDSGDPEALEALEALEHVNDREGAE